MSLFNKNLTITGDQLVELLSSKPLIIDVREKNEFVSGHIPGAQNIPLGELDYYQGKADNIYVVCHSGVRSEQGAQILKERGYKAVNVKHGMLGWNGPVAP